MSRKSQSPRGSIRVGTIKFADKGKKIYPSYEGFENIEVMTASTAYGDLGPYILKDEEGRIMENVWQFSKIYREVPATTQKYSRWDGTITWSHPKETHIDDDGVPTEKYWEWRNKGFYNEYAVRYPVGFGNMHKCVGTILLSDSNDLYGGKVADGEYEVVDYITARKCIYSPLYKKLARQQPKYKILLDKLRNGENLLIMEVDGPQQKSLEYYKQTYGVEDDFIEDNTILITKDTLDLMMNDTKHPYGHGYCLSDALLEDLEGLCL